MPMPDDPERYSGGLNYLTTHYGNSPTVMSVVQHAESYRRHDCAANTASSATQGRIERAIELGRRLTQIQDAIKELKLAWTSSSGDKFAYGDSKLIQELEKERKRCRKALVELG